jgi:hypothetical protein
MTPMARASTLVALIVMAQSYEAFVLGPRSSHYTGAGILFELEEGGHKHGEGGLQTGRWTLRFQRGQRKEKLEFAAGAPEDFYGEGDAFGILFRIMGEALGGGVKIALLPLAGVRPPAPAKCGDVLKKVALPAGVSLAGGAAVREGPGTCIFSSLNGSTVVVFGRRSLEVLYTRHAPPRPSPR